MEYKHEFKVSGKILEIGEAQTFASGFTKRNVVVETSKDEDYSSPVQVTLKKDRCDLADSLVVGDGVAVDGWVEGRRWEGKDGAVRYFTDLTVRAIVVTEKAERPTTATTWKELLALGAAYGESDDAVKERAKKLGKEFKKMQEADWQKLADQIVQAHAAPDIPPEDSEGPDEEALPF